MTTGRYHDAHTHILPPDRLGKLVRWIRTAIPDHGVPADITPEEAIADLRRNGVVRWANLLFPIFPGEARDLHRWGAELAERHPGMTPFGGVRPDDDDPLGIVEEAIEERGMAGLKFHPFVQRFVPWDERLADVIRYLEERERPVYVHTGYDAWYGDHLDRSELERFIADHPRLPFVLPHIGYPDLAWGFRVARTHPNVWLDATNVFGSVALEQAARRPALAAILRSGLTELRGRVMFGTDHPAGMGSVERIFEDLDRFDLAEDVREDLLLHAATAFFDRYGRPRP